MVKEQIAYKIAVVTFQTIVIAVATFYDRWRRIKGYVKQVSKYFRKNYPEKEYFEQASGERRSEKKVYCKRLNGVFIVFNCQL